MSVSIPTEYDNYNDYQKKLFKKVKQLQKKGLGYRKIAQWLNKNNYKTSRGNIFKNTNVFSVIKKGKLRAKRLKNIKMHYDEVKIKYPNELQF